MDGYLGIKGKGYEGSGPVDVLGRMLPDGGLVGADWLQAYVARGYGWHVTIGSFSTPIVGGGNGTVLDLDQPEGVLSVPAGTVLIPLRVDIQLQKPLLAADSDEVEALVTLDRASAWAGDGTFTAESPIGMRTDVTSGCEVTCASAFTADMTVTTGADPVHHLDFAREVQVGDVQGTAATVWWNAMRLLWEPKYPPMIVGPACLLLYWGGTVATSGFAQCQFLSLPASKFTNLS